MDQEVIQTEEEITKKNVLRAIKRMKNGKAPGTRTKMLKALCNAGIEILTELFRKVCNDDKIRLAIIIPIFTKVEHK